MKLSQESRSIIFAKAKINPPAPNRIGVASSPLKNNSQVSFQGLRINKAFFSKYLARAKAVLLDSNAQYRVSDKAFEAIDDVLDDRLKNLVSEGLDLAKNTRFASKFKIKDNTYFFEDKGLFKKIAQKIAHPFSTFWLDVTNNALEKIGKKGGVKSTGLLSQIVDKLNNSKILKSRKEVVAADKVFDTIHGIFNKSLPKGGSVIADDLDPKILSNLYSNIASKNKGNYSTEAERAFNKIACGLVSGSFAARDFYNITRYHNDNHEEAKKAKDKRFRQELTRASVNSLLIFGTMGALSKLANSNRTMATTILVLTTLVAETTSRLVNGTPILPLSTEKAKKLHAKKYGTSRQNPSQIENTQNVKNVLTDIVSTPNAIEAYKKNVLSGSDYSKKSANFTGNEAVLMNNAALPLTQSANQQTAQGAIQPLSQASTQSTVQPAVQHSSQTAQNSTDNTKDKTKKQSTMLQKIITGFGILFTAGFVVGFARNKSKSFYDFSDGIAGFIKKHYKKVTSGSELVSKKEVDKLISKIREAGNTNLANDYKKILEGAKIQVVNAQGKGAQEFYKLEKEANFFKPLIDILLFPFEFALKAPKLGRKFFNLISHTKDIAAVSKSTKVGQEAVLNTYKKFGKKMDNPDFAQYFDNFVRKTLNVNTSNHNNKELLGNFLLFNTLVPSYFFVNDFRNHELIETNGENTESIKATTNTKIGQRCVNYFSNSLFINIFTSLFGKVFNGSLLGATAVTALTEFTNETTIRKLIGVPLKEMSKDELAEFDSNNYYADGFKGKYMRFVSKLTGKKPLGEKAKDQEKKKAEKK